jgi:SNF2 family DNA or RNA helicase
VLAASPWPLCPKGPAPLYTEPPLLRVESHSTLRLITFGYVDAVLLRGTIGDVIQPPDRATTKEHFAARRSWIIPATRDTIDRVYDLYAQVNIDPEVYAHLDNLDAQANARVDSLQGESWPADGIDAVPYKHQRQGFHTLKTLIDTGSDACALWHDMGLGKTLTALALVAELEPRAVLVLCPKAVIPSWIDHAEKFYTKPIRVLAPRKGTVASKAGQLVAAHMEAFDGTTLIVLNYETFWRPAMLKVLEQLGPQIVVADEAHRLKSVRSKQAQGARKIGKHAIRLALTGTPIDNLTDWYGIYRWLDPRVFGTNKMAFELKYFDTYQPPGQMFRIIKGVKPAMEDELTARANTLAHSCKKEDALDLPEKISLVRSCELEPAARKLYVEMRDEAIAELAGGDVSVGQNVLTRLLRLQQITGGYLKDEAGAVHAVSDAKLTLLSDTLDDVLAQHNKVIVFARFTGEIDAIRALIENRKPRVSVDVYDGRNASTRDAIIDDFVNTEDPRVLVVQTKAGGAGLNLQVAACAIYYSLGASLIDWQQSQDRIHRIGQDRACTYITLVCENTIDERVLEALEAKKTLSDLSVYRQLLSPSTKEART